MAAPKPVEKLERQDERILKDKGRKKVDKINDRLVELKVVTVPTDSVYPNPYNPNRQSESEFDMLKKSILDDGFTQPIVVHEETKMIVDGEHRWRAMNQLGVPEIPVVFVNMTEQQMRISTLRHNRARGSEDIELSTQVLRDLRELGALDKAIDSLNINDLELQALLDDLPAPDQMAQDEFSEAWIPATTKPAYKPEELIGDRRISTSAAAQETLATYDGMIDDAETQTEKGALNQAAHLQVSQISVTFKKQQAKLVRSVLGKKPAQRLVELCVEMVLANPSEQKDWIVEIAETMKARWTSKG